MAAAAVLAPIFRLRLPAKKAAIVIEEKEEKEEKGEPSSRKRARTPPPAAVQPALKRATVVTDWVVVWLREKPTWLLPSMPPLPPLKPPPMLPETWLPLLPPPVPPSAYAHDVASIAPTAMRNPLFACGVHSSPVTISSLCMLWNRLYNRFLF